MKYAPGLPVTIPETLGGEGVVMGLRSNWGPRYTVCRPDGSCIDVAAGNITPAGEVPVYTVGVTVRVRGRGPGKILEREQDDDGRWMYRVELPPRPQDRARGHARTTRVGPEQILS